MSLIAVFVVAAVVLLAVLVGAAVPPLLQLRSTLKSLEVFLDETRPRLHVALDQVTEATGRVNRAAAGLEEGMDKVRGVADKVAALGETLDGVRESVRKVSAAVSAIGPAVVAGFRAFWPAGGDEGPAPETEDASRTCGPETGHPDGYHKETS